MHIYVRQSLSIPQKTHDKHWREFLFAYSMHASFNDSLLIGSNFDHYEKKHYSKISNNFPFKLKLISTLGYSSNTSLSRIFDAWFFSIKLFFYILLKTPPRSTVICSFPTPESSLFACLASVLKRDKFILDFRDAWPEALVSDNKLLSFIFKIYIRGILFLIKPFVKSTIYMSGKMHNYYDLDSRSLILPNWFPSVKQNDVPRQLSIVFAGTLSSQFDFTLLTKLSSLSCFNGFTFDIYGGGPFFDFYEKMFRDYDKIVFHGKVDYGSLMSSYHRCAMFLIPYSNPVVFENHLNNKMIEMIAFNKPIITNLRSCCFWLEGAPLNIGFNFNEIENFKKTDMMEMLETFDNKASGLFSKDNFDIKLKEFLSR